MVVTKQPEGQMVAMNKPSPVDVREAWETVLDCSPEDNADAWASLLTKRLANAGNFPTEDNVMMIRLATQGMAGALGLLKAVLNGDKITAISAVDLNSVTK